MRKRKETTNCCTNNNGVEQSTCSDCSEKCMEQTGDKMSVGSKNMYCLLGMATNTPKFAQHSLDRQHTIGTADNGMALLYVTNKR